MDWYGRSKERAFGGRRPLVLFHATFQDRMPAIRNEGLAPGKQHNWMWSSLDVVCLAALPEIAVGFAQDSDYGPKKDQVVLLAVSTQGLDWSKMTPDRNVPNSEIGEYHGTIPPGNIKVIEDRSTSGRIWDAVESMGGEYDPKP
jgi:hypothetical protein